MILENILINSYKNGLFPMVFHCFFIYNIDILHKRGKFILTAFVFIIFCSVYLEIFQIIVNAENEKEIMADKNKIISPLKADLNNEGKDKGPYDNDDLNGTKKVFVKTDTVSQTSKNENLNNVLTIPVENIFDDNGKKVAFLTFDDGPSKNISPQILSILKKYNVRATFFVLGKYAEINKGVIKDIYKDGNVIGLHGYSHKYDVIYSSEESFKDEINRTSSILNKILGDNFKTRLFRFPGGSFENSKDKFKTILKDMSYAYVDWNVVIGDAEVKSTNSSSKVLYDRFISTVKNKNHVILLMHDSATKQETADILPKVIEYLKSQGYEFAVFK
jgi:peptidoglycan/xylan/chitin deacetylase (PgdA/CDA1 family)